MEGPYGSSLSLAALGDPSLLAITFGTIYGKLLLLRLLALAGAAAVWWNLRRTDRPLGRLDTAGLALLVVESFSFAGHAGQGTWVPLAATMDALHMAAASVWLGGLTVLAVILWGRSGTESATELASILPRWSRTAIVAVSVLVATGLYQSWRQAGSVDAVLTTGSGRLILAKVAVFACLLGLAYYGRRWFQHQGRLRWSVAAEVGLGVTVLALTSALVNSVPAGQAYSPTFDTALVGQAGPGTEIRVHLVIAPTRFGFQSVRIETADRAGARTAFESATGSLTEPRLGIGPIDFAFQPTGTGAAEATAVSVPAPGSWQLVLSIRTDQSTSYSVTTTYTVQ